jgi:hypothetical protein
MKKTVSRMEEEEDSHLGIPEGILERAIKEVNSKDKEHGDTEQSFRMIADLWSIYVKHAHTVHAESWVTPHDVAQLMILIKVARSVYGYSEDNFVDTAGYAALAAMFKESEG